VATAAVDAAATASRLQEIIDVRMQRVELPVHIERLSQRVHDAIARAGFVLPMLARTGGLRATARALHAAGRADLAQAAAALQGMTERTLVHRDMRTYVATHCGHVSVGHHLEAIVAPGEVLTRLALPLRGAMGSRHRMFFGLTHDTLGYFIPEDEWRTGRNGNYEESVSLGHHAGSVLADVLLSLVPRHREAV
jgi:hypothetical protein